MNTINVQGVDLPVGDQIRVKFSADTAGETLVPVIIENDGGLLTCKKSLVATRGLFRLEPFQLQDAHPQVQVAFESPEQMHMGLARISKLIRDVFSLHPVDSVSVTIGVGIPVEFAGTLTWDRPTPGNSG